jgi:phosphoribosyl 1,2-cyclic phosphate phosphodiesterase
MNPVKSNFFLKTVHVLGSGTSTGVPVVACSCRVCQSPREKDKRLRSSVMLEFSNPQNEKKFILVDTTPDLRTQLLRGGFTHLDGVIITHEHADHLHGLDDLRPLSLFQQKDLPLWTSSLCAGHMRRRFSYAFAAEEKNRALTTGGGIPTLTLHELSLKKTVTLAGIDFIFFALPHGHTTTLGFTTNHFSYLIDCHEIPEGIFPLLENTETLIIDCVRLKPHHTHLYWEKTLQYVQQIQAKRSYIIHMGHDFTHEEWNDMCSEAPLKKGHSLEASFDQMQIHIQ